MAKNYVSLNRYCRQVKSWLPCSWAEKRRIVKRIRDQVIRFLEENSDANCAQIEARFGTPQQIAAAALEEMGTCEVLLDLRVRRKLVSIVAAGIAVIALAWSIFVTYAIINTELFLGTKYTVWGKVIEFDKEEDRWVFSD